MTNSALLAPVDEFDVDPDAKRRAYIQNGELVWAPATPDPDADPILLHQRLSNGASGLFSAAEFDDVNSSDDCPIVLEKFSNIISLDDSMRHDDGKFQFRLVYQDTNIGSDVIVEWRQESHLNDTAIVGFEEISNSTGSPEFQGLARHSSGAGSGSYDTSPGSNNWWWSIGNTALFNGGTFPVNQSPLVTAKIATLYVVPPAETPQREQDDRLDDAETAITAITVDAEVLSGATDADALLANMPIGKALHFHVATNAATITTVGDLRELVDGGDDTAPADVAGNSHDIPVGAQGYLVKTATGIEVAYTSPPTDTEVVFKNTGAEVSNGTGANTGNLETSFTATVAGDYIFEYSGNVVSGTGGISVGTVAATSDLFVSAPPTGDADGARLTATRQENFSPPITLAEGQEVFIAQWAGGGGLVQDHTVCVVGPEQLDRPKACSPRTTPTPAVSWTKSAGVTGGAENLTFGGAGATGGVAEYDYILPLESAGTKYTFEYDVLKNAAGGSLISFLLEVLQHGSVIYTEAFEAQGAVETKVAEFFPTASFVIRITDTSPDGANRDGWIQNMSVISSCEGMSLPSPEVAAFGSAQVMVSAAATEADRQHITLTNASGNGFGITDYLFHLSDDPDTVGTLSGQTITIEQGQPLDLYLVGPSTEGAGDGDFQHNGTVTGIHFTVDFDGSNLVYNVVESVRHHPGPGDYETRTYNSVAANQTVALNLLETNFDLLFKGNAISAPQQQVPSACEINRFIHSGMPKFHLVFAHEGDGGTSMIARKNGVPVTYQNLVNGTDVGNGQVNFSGGANGNFNRRASTAEFLQYPGDYFEIDKPATPSFDGEYAALLTDPAALANTATDAWRWFWNPSTWFLRDATNTEIAGNEGVENGTYKVELTLAGFNFYRNGVLIHEVECEWEDFNTPNEDSRARWTVTERNTAGQPAGDGLFPFQ